MTTPIDWIEQRVNALAWKGKTLQVKDKVRSIIYKNYALELSKPPQIAIIGKAGVGKTSTINALFNTKLRVGRTHTGTHKAQSVSIQTNAGRIHGERGELIIYDLPGLGDDIDHDLKNTQIYYDVLSKCDVAVWVIAAEDRSLSSDQRLINEVVRYSNPDLFSRLVIGINKLDLVSPSNWNQKINLPSKAQERNFTRVLKRVKKSILKVCPDISDEQFVGYSATKYYNLLGLFRVMIESCPRERAWVLNDRASIANLFSLLPDYLRDDLLDVPGDRIYGPS